MKPLRLSAFFAGLVCFPGILPLFCPAARPVQHPHYILNHHAIVRADTTQKKIAIIFTGGDYADGGMHIRDVLLKNHIKAGFFFTGDFYRHPDNAVLIRHLLQDGHYLGPHSDKHLLYCDWNKRDSSLVTRVVFLADLRANYQIMQKFQVRQQTALFIPPYEWYNREQTAWAASMGVTLFNFTPGIGTQADYTTPDMGNYRSSRELYQRLFAYEKNNPSGLNGAILLIHIGTHPARKDKFYLLLEPALQELHTLGYRAVRIDSLVIIP